MGLFALLPLIHVTIGLLIFFGGMNAEGGGPPAAFGLLFVVIGGLFVVVGLTVASLVVLSGRYLSQRRRHTFCLVVAAVECMFVPFGTVLGVLTIVLLIQDEVKALFDAPAPAPDRMQPPGEA